MCLGMKLIIGIRIFLGIYRHDILMDYRDLTFSFNISGLSLESH